MSLCLYLDTGFSDFSVFSSSYCYTIITLQVFVLFCTCFILLFCLFCRVPHHRSALQVGPQTLTPSQMLSTKPSILSISLSWTTALPRSIFTPTGEYIAMVMMMKALCWAKVPCCYRMDRYGNFASKWWGDMEVFHPANSGTLIQVTFRILLKWYSSKILLLCVFV